VSVSAEQDGQRLNPALAWGPGLGDEIAHTPPGGFLSPTYIYSAQAIFERDGGVERIAATSLTGPSAYEGTFRYGGVEDHYFIAATVTPGPMRLEYTPLTLPAADNPASIGRYVSWSVQFQSAPDQARFYVGPKQFDVLRAVDPEFTRVIYFGMFAWLAVPLLGALQWVNGFVGNYGWSIIILTVLINLVMWPLRHKSVVSMRRMQELQPQMKAIQDRYAQYKITDPQRQNMNQEVMELYRSKGVNPASGCVPMLLTIPFLFAFYAMLSQVIEIRGASFGGWIRDLSQPDPLFLTPVLMGLSMFWQQKITPTSADPTQQKIMMFMPVMVTVMMLYAPSGLVIYWLVSNVWGIGQQYLTNYLIGPAKVHNVRPPAERRVKT
jgi:YidC/Oxa1 family membrane protein insertase